jgi:serine/threonine-protein kinase HipA
MNRQPVGARCELEVKINSSRVGSICRRRDGNLRLSLDEWLPWLGWAFVLDTRVRESRRLPVWFENLLPETGSPLRRWVCLEHGLHEDDSLELLRALGRDLPGAVEVHDLHERDDYEDACQRFSVAGMQPKLSMIRCDDDRWVLPAKDELGDWFVKLAGARYGDLPIVEDATMSWARAAGLDVPTHRLVPVEQLIDVEPSFLAGTTSAFAVRRFDRVEGERIHQEDLAQALEIHPYDKYGGPGRLAVSYDSLTRLVSDACGDEGLGQMIERVAFMIACGNDDAHLKNWSFQWLPGEARPRLSPCYDLVATVAWPEFGWGGDSEPELALPFARSKRLADLDGARVRLFAQRAGAPAGVERFMATLERAKQAWLEREVEAPVRMRTALVEHWARVPVLRALGGLAVGPPARA